MSVSFDEKEYTASYGKGIKGEASPDGKCIVLRIALDGKAWQSNGPKKSMMLASTGGFVTTQTGAKVSANVMAPK